MKDIYVIDVIEKCGGRLVCGDNNAICDNFKIDTREIKENDTFVGIKGENFDGNAMYEKAFENLDLGYASAMAVILLVIVMAFSLVNILCFEKNKYQI